MRWWLAAVAVGLAACGPPPATPWTWSLPTGTPAPAVPKDNPLTVEKVELGRHLFFDKRLSVNETTSCGTCHEQAKGFADGKALPTGALGDVVPRNAPGLLNVAYLSVYTWMNPNLLSLEQQALVPMFGESPVELGLSQGTEGILDRFRADATYRQLFADAFPDETQRVTKDTVVKAIASFQRALVSWNAPYDRYLRGERAALSESAVRGMTLFFTEKAECYHCHVPPNFTSSYRTERTTSVAPLADFQNTGLYDIDGQGSYPAPNVGLVEHTGDAAHSGAFRVPPLRNVALTAPYLHDGSAATLSDVLDLYAAGGRNVTSGPSAGDGRANPNKNAFVRQFELTAQEKADLLAFLEALTDRAVLDDPRFGDPFTP